MPIEAIKRIQRERAEKAAAEEAARKAAEEKARLEKEEAERQKNEEAERRLQFVIQQTEKVLKESSALAGLQRIDSELLDGNVAEHAIVENFDKGKVSLVWGSKLHVRNGKILVGESRVYQDQFNYSYIQITVDPDNEILRISAGGDCLLKKREWSNKEAVDKALVDAYLNPHREEYPIPHSSDSYGGSSSDDFGCCSCSGK